ncbi:MAG: 1-acyl-sn-glycerol-3-phosphate acyltransferase [Cyclobacteriaceae bacterium]
MIQYFFRLVFIKILGWRIIGDYPYHEKKLIIIVAPHTSLWDFAVGVAVRGTLNFKSNFLAKAELFKNPILSKVLTWTGGVPVDRGNRKANVVGSVVDIYNEREEFVIALAPEGTRSKVRHLKSGFYRIAKEANIPILIAGFDFKKKTVEFLPLLRPGEDMDADMEYIMKYYRTLHGKNPELGLE